MSIKHDNIALIVEALRIQGIDSDEQIAYVLATTEHETANTFEPVKEAFWLSEEWREKNLRYYPYYGRGFTQLTWVDNYSKMNPYCAGDIVAYPDLAMDPVESAMVMAVGFKEGMFTGEKITNYIDGDDIDFIGARRCINGTDKAEHIAELAEKWLYKIVTYKQRIS